ncbi:MAG: aspartate--tRNA ligase [Oscillospiraceae bacterium]|nr:aspartate--tRNA ligase [Oscillospiraceae bacterium]
MSDTINDTINNTMRGLARTHYCGELRIQNAGASATVCGFVQKIRDKGGLVFIDLRDRTGIIQLVFDEHSPAGLPDKAKDVRGEYVLMAKGTVRERSAKNPELATGDIELAAEDLRILSRAQTPPFEIALGDKVREELRLEYRYLDLRRAEMQDMLMMRHKITKATRDYFDRHGFLEIETPMLIKSTPEGARDYLVPSRVHPGAFYALPQSPQLFKQLLMLSGCDRYMQIARCFRDEDLRADRQPEFTQIDLEMSFVDENDVMGMTEGFIAEVFGRVLDRKIAVPFQRLLYAQAMERFGSDKPDTRFGMELADLTGILKDTEWEVFAAPIREGGSIRAINAKGAAGALSRKEIDRLTDIVKTYRARGLAFTRLQNDGTESSSYEKFLTDEEKSAIRAAVNAEAGDVILIVADAKNEVVFDALGSLRLHLGEKLGLYSADDFCFLWVTDFPLFEYDEESGRYAAKHHPFTAPKPEDTESFTKNPAAARARAYDMVLNGSEIGGGSIRISDPVLQARMFEALGIDEETANERFGFLLEAFRYGVPPHGGLAFGLDRLVMLMLGKSSIRDVIAFPKVQNAGDLMTACPSPVDAKSLEELHINIVTD